MTSLANCKIIKELIGQTPLIIDPHRDGTRFQNALAGLSDSKLENFYNGLNAEERRRFHYTANVCLGYDSWCQLYRSLVINATQERLADRLEGSYAARAQDLAKREAALEQERLTLGEQIMGLEAENQILRKENQQLVQDLEDIRKENQQLAQDLEDISKEKGLLLEQRQQMQEMVDRYRRLIADLKSTLVK